MALKTFVDNSAPVIDAEWLNEVDALKETTVPAISTDLASVAAGKGDSLIGVKRDATGSVARTQHSKNNDTLCVFDFLTDAQIADVQAHSLSFDATAAIQAAIDDCPLGGRVWVPGGKYLISAPLTITRHMIFEGDGWGTILVMDSDMTSAQDAIYCQPATATEEVEYRRLILRNFLLVPEAGLTARHGINIDVNGSQSWSYVVVEGVRIQGTRNYSLKNYGPYSSAIFNNFFDSVSFDRGADNHTFVHNTVFNSNPACHGIYVDCVAGSNNFVIKNNVILCNGGKELLYVKYSGWMTIAENQFETQSASVLTGASAIKLVGVSDNVNYGPLYNVLLRENNFNIVVSHGFTRVIYSDNTAHTIVSRNMFYLSLGVPTLKAFETTANTYNFVWEDNFNFVQGTTAEDLYNGSRVQFNIATDLFVDAGFGTVGLWKALTLLTDITSNATYGTPRVGKVQDDIVHLTGGVTIASPTEAKALFVLPAGFRPDDVTVVVPVSGYNGSAWSQVALRITADGSTYLVGTAGTITSVSLDGAKFKRLYS